VGRIYNFFVEAGRGGREGQLKVKTSVLKSCR
jgi:hypothetical protein